MVFYCRSALDPDYCADSRFRGANERVGLEHCRKDLLLLSGFLLQVGVRSGLLRGLSFPGRQRAGGTRALHEGHAGDKRGAKLCTHLEKGKKYAATKAARKNYIKRDIQGHSLTSIPLPPPPHAHIFRSVNNFVYSVTMYVFRQNKLLSTQQIKFLI